MTRQRGTALGLVVVGVVAWWVVAARGGVSLSPPSRLAALATPVPALLFDYDAQRLRLDSSDVPAVRGSRNPFRFAEVVGPETAPNSRGGSARAPFTSPRAPDGDAEPIPFTLIGIATRGADETTSRVAVLAGDGQLILAAPGESVASRYIVVAVAEDAVELRHAASGRVVRLALR